MDTASRLDPSRFTWQRDANGSLRRPLGGTELGFYLDFCFNGVAITIHHTEFDSDEDVAHRVNVEAAWLRLKQRFPLLGATIEETHEDGHEKVEFVLKEERLHTVPDGELYFDNNIIESNVDVFRLIDHFQNGAPTLTNDRIAQLWLLRQNDTPGRYHFIILAAHFITGGIAGATYQRELCHELAIGTRERSIVGGSLDERVKDLLPLEVLSPFASLSLPTRRWRHAVAAVISRNRQAKLSGGHTLPKMNNPDAGMPPVSRTISVKLPPSLTREIMKNCRSLGLTFGSALPVFGQLAHAKLLLRLRFGTLNTRFSCNAAEGRGDCYTISEEEWQHRLIQPCHFGGPMNLRPYLDRNWYERGGVDDVCLAISFFFFQLPFMPLRPSQNEGCMSTWENARYNTRPMKNGPNKKAHYGAERSSLNAPEIRTGGALSSAEIPPFCVSDRTPNYESLLPFARFCYRAKLVQLQNTHTLKHPLLHELHAAQLPGRLNRAKAHLRAWRERLHSGISNEMSPQQQLSPVMTNGGASVGNRDLIFPLNYPLTSKSEASHSETRLCVTGTSTHFRCRPAELYLGAATSRGALDFFCFADVSVYNETLVRAWVHEVANAAVTYLGPNTKAEKYAKMAKL